MSALYNDPPGPSRDGSSREIGRRLGVFIAFVAAPFMGARSHVGGWMFHHEARAGVKACGYNDEATAVHVPNPRQSAQR